MFESSLVRGVEMFAAVGDPWFQLLMQEQNHVCSSSWHSIGSSYHHAKTVCCSQSSKVGKMVISP